MAHHRYKYIVTPAWLGLSGEVHPAIYSGLSYNSRRAAKVAWKAQPRYLRSCRDNYMELVTNDHLFGAVMPEKRCSPTKAVRYGR